MKLSFLNRKTGFGSNGPENQYQPVHPVQGGPWRLILGVTVVILLVIYGAIHYVGTTEPFRMAAAFVQDNEEIKAAVGEIEDCTPWFPSTVNWTSQRMQVFLTLRVAGRAAATKAWIQLVQEHNRWRIISASYEDKAGAIRALAVKGKGATPDSAGAAAPGGFMKASEYLAQGDRFLKKNELDRAIAAYSRALAANPEEDQAYCRRGIVYFKKNLPDQALADFRKAVELNPQNADANAWLGYFAGKGERYDECITHLSRTIEQRADNGWAYYLRGRCYFQKGDRAKARDDAEKSCRLGYADGCRAYKNLGGKSL